MHLSRLFQRSVKMYGSRPALAHGRSAPVTYAELDRRVRALARWLLQDQGLARGDRVVLAMKNCTEYAEALLALWTAGLCPVPVNSKLHPQEIAYMLDNSGSRLCLSTGELLEQLRPVVSRMPGIGMVDMRGQAWREAQGGEPLSRAEATGRENELAWLFYTSGTTGRPKGVMLTHANVVAMSLNFFADVLAIDEQDVLIHVAPMSHGGGLYSIPYMLRGGLQVIPETGGLDEAELFDLLSHYDKASFFAAPTIVRRMVEHAKLTRVSEDAKVCPGLRCMLTGGAPFYVEDIKAAVQIFGPRIAQMYGQGETPMTISALSAARIAQAVDEGDEELLASVGYPQTTVEVDILDSEGRPVPPGTLGEVTVRSPTVMPGYWNNPDATAKTISNGVLYTGDIGLIDTQGRLHLRDRSKDVIISGGTNIYPREVEEVLLRHPGVAEVSVIGTSDPDWGEAVTAVVVAHGGHALDRATLDALCIENIARFKRPKHYVFMEALPKNATGKVLKNELRQSIGAQGASEVDSRQRNRSV